MKRISTTDVCPLGVKITDVALYALLALRIWERLVFWAVEVVWVRRGAVANLRLVELQYSRH